MQSPPSRSARLLHADEEQLDRAAIGLRSGTAFVIAVCSADLRGAALDRLRAQVKGLAPPGPVEIGTPDEMMGALMEQQERGDRVLSLTLGGDVLGALDGLNLHREKVLGGAPVILWLDDVAMLAKVRERAPDAFSFRSTMVVVSGDGGPLPTARAEETEEVQRLRKRLKRARTPLERAGAGQGLAEVLRVRGRHREAEVQARSALDELRTGHTDDEHLVRGRLCLTMGSLAWEQGKIRPRIGLEHAGARRDRGGVLRPRARSKGQDHGIVPRAATH